MNEFEHISVLPAAVLDALTPTDGGYYVDMTTGGAGHLRAVLDASAPGGQVLGLDRDPRALAIATERLAPYEDRAQLHLTPFSSVYDVVQEARFGVFEAGAWRVDGVLLDAGVSSPQLDDPERGFSFRAAGPLDMRMGPDAPSLREWLDEADATVLTRVLRDYGEIRDAKRLAVAIVRARDDGELTDTHALAEVCRRVLRKPGPQRIDAATLPFQALRIAVNDELGQLRAALDAMPSLLRQGGVAAVISFHSLEDRLVKQAFTKLVRPTPVPRGLPIRGTGSADYEWVERLRRPDDHECTENPRARSSKLRAIRRIAPLEAP